MWVLTLIAVVYGIGIQGEERYNYIRINTLHCCVFAVSGIYAKARSAPKYTNQVGFLPGGVISKPWYMFATFIVFYVTLALMQSTNLICNWLLETANGSSVTGGANGFSEDDWDLAKFLANTSATPLQIETILDRHSVVPEV
jgi:hypothetical protein